MFSKNVNILKLSEPCYPKSLTNIPDPPKVLHFSGTPPSEWETRPKVAIVGSRKQSPYGSSTTELLASRLASNGVVIVSGLAYGVDVTAHKAALAARGLTVAVLPGGLDQIYPTVHTNIAHQIILTGGCLITEYPPKTSVQRFNFIARNRIISSLADALVITEAAINSGSLHTARFALEQGKTVLAVPGNINSPQSEGTNNLIKSGAGLVNAIEDIFYALDLPPPTKTKKRSFIGPPEEEAIFKLIAGGVSSQDELTILTNMSPAKVSQALTGLEIAGAIKPEGNGRWIVF